MFDLTQRETFLNVRDWHASLRKYKDTTQFPVIIVGNKLDLCDGDDDRREVAFDEAWQAA